MKKNKKNWIGSKKNDEGMSIWYNKDSKLGWIEIE